MAAHRSDETKATCPPSRAVKHLSHHCPPATAHTQNSNIYTGIPIQARVRWTQGQGGDHYRPPPGRLSTHSKAIFPGQEAGRPSRGVLLSIYDSGVFDLSISISLSLSLSLCRGHASPYVDPLWLAELIYEKMLTFWNGRVC